MLFDAPYLRRRDSHASPYAAITPPFRRRFSPAFRHRLPAITAAFADSQHAAAFAAARFRCAGRQQLSAPDCAAAAIDASDFHFAAYFRLFASHAFAATPFRHAAAVLPLLSMPPFAMPRFRHAFIFAFIPLMLNLD